jgi:hypothetical protein
LKFKAESAGTTSQKARHGTFLQSASTPKYHVSGSAGRTLKTDSLRISTVPGFASLGFLTYRARVQDTATTPPSLALL